MTTEPANPLATHQGATPPAPKKPAPPASPPRKQHPAGLQTITDLERDALLQFVPGAVRLAKNPLSPAEPFIDGYVMGIASLGPGWNDRKLKFSSRDQALAFLQDHGFNLGPGSNGSPAGAIDNALSTQWGMGGHDQATQNSWLADELVTGWAWIVPTYAPPFQNPGLGANLAQKLILTTAAVTDKLNKDSGTDIDFLFTSANEGGQWQRGYVPYGYFKKTKTSHVIGASGVTIASGLDLGQQSVAGLKAAKFPQSYIDLFTNYIHRPLTHDDHASACRYILAHGPMPILTQKADADEVDRLSYVKMLSAVEAVWSTAQQLQTRRKMLVKAGDPPIEDLKNFTDLSGAWQTVLFDYSYQHGTGNSGQGLQKCAFGHAALMGNADDAKKALLATSVGNAKNPDRTYLQWERLNADASTLTVPAAPAPKVPPAANNPLGKKP